MSNFRLRNKACPGPIRENGETSSFLTSVKAVSLCARLPTVSPLIESAGEDTRFSFVKIELLSWPTTTITLITRGYYK